MKAALQLYKCNPISEIWANQMLAKHWAINKY